MFVQLLTYTSDAEQTVAAAARLCYSPASIADLVDKSAGDRAGFLKKILSLGHFSVLEHASFSFGVEGISRTCSHQLVRHRLASYSQQSQRYVSHREQFSAVTPPTIAARPELQQRYQEAMQQAHAAYRDLVDAGIPAEDARFVLPNAAETKIVVTMNARELWHFFNLRCCRRAQWEIRELARLMLAEARRKAPALFAEAGPGCLRGSCPEGAMSCGEAAAVKDEFANLT